MTLNAAENSTFLSRRATSRNGIPLIAICPGFEERGRRRRGTHEVYLYAEYYEAIEQAGGAPVVLLTSESLDLVPAILSRVDGVLLTGGPDLHPSTYGQELHDATRPMHPRRQSFDLHVLRVAEELDLPVFAICLGIQILNVARGGSLIQHVPSCAGRLCHDMPAGQPDATHAVTVEPDTLLAGILGAGQHEVNSSHHQAIDRVGERLVVSARCAVWRDARGLNDFQPRSADGLVEAVEDPRHRFHLGVQWHPERVMRRPSRARGGPESAARGDPEIPKGRHDQLALFEAFVAACREYSGSRA